MGTDEFDLRQAVRAVLAETSLASPRDIASKVAENTPRRAMPAAYQAALTTYVRVEMAHERRQASQPEPESTRRVANASSRVTAIREAWRRHLRTRVHVGQGSWALLGDCGHDQIVFVAEERRRMAELNAAAAERFEALAQALVKHKAARVADLPDRVLANLLGDVDGAAA